MKTKFQIEQINNKQLCYIFRDNINNENLQIRIIKADSDKLSSYMISPVWMCAGSCELTDATIDIFKRRKEFFE